MIARHHGEHMSFTSMKEPVYEPIAGKIALRSLSVKMTIAIATVRAHIACVVCRHALNAAVGATIGEHVAGVKPMQRANDNLGQTMANNDQMQLKTSCDTIAHTQPPINPQIPTQTDGCPCGCHAALPVTTSLAQLNQPIHVIQLNT